MKLNQLLEAMYKTTEKNGEITVQWPGDDEIYFQVDEFQTGKQDYDDDPSAIKKLNAEAKKLYAAPNTEKILKLIDDQVEKTDLFGAECYNGWWIDINGVEEVKGLLGGDDDGAIEGFTDEDRDTFKEWKVFNDKVARDKLSKSAKKILRDLCVFSLKPIIAKTDIWLQKNK